ncbi:ABC transporter permease [Williamsia maris]|uniref:ABC-2 type transport system permease protein n=1 Tax=Williamsia maris TaxID=72806 RepID=A0ABT1HCF9_9NOCA|nr:ABC transporter permease subunit [Williamsia maris]MCP2175607.1 ABC-2 type transport system permease protein [Williamsia maris]
MTDNIGGDVGGVDAGGRAAATRKGVHDRLDGIGPVQPSTFRPGRTLSLRVEAVRQLRRRRTQVAALLLLVLPPIIAIAFSLSSDDPSTAGSDGGGRQNSALYGLATAGGANFALFTEFAAGSFLLTVLIALFCGDTVASDAGWASLRYLLVIPVRRSHLLRQKLFIGLASSAIALILLPLWAYVVGGLFFGWGPAQSPLGGEFTNGETLQRLAIVVGYTLIQSLVIAGFAFLLSVVTDAPLGAVGGATMLVILSNILDAISALDPYRQYLPTHYQFAWLDALGPNVIWEDMARGAGISLIYSSVLFGFAWWWFGRKDVVS